MEMQKRRRSDTGSEPEAAMAPSAAEFWERLEKMPLDSVCVRTGAMLTPEGHMSLACLNEIWTIEVKKRKFRKMDGEFGGEWDRQFPFLGLIYLVSASGTPLSGDMVAPRELVKGSDFFQGIYKIDTGELEEVFGSDSGAFKAVAHKLGARITENADCGARFTVFPRMVVEYLLWTGDEEFPARLSLLLDRDTTSHFPPDATSMLIRLLNGRLLFEKGR
jgi:hypothetical protein